MSIPQHPFQAPELPSGRPITISQRGAIAKLTCRLFDLVVAIIALVLTGYYGIFWTGLLYMPLVGSRPHFLIVPCFYSISYLIAGHTELNNIIIGHPIHRMAPGSVHHTCSPQK
jgi:hypothetical protein